MEIITGPILTLQPGPQGCTWEPGSGAPAHLCGFQQQDKTGAWTAVSMHLYLVFKNNVYIHTRVYSRVNCLPSLSLKHCPIS